MAAVSFESTAPGAAVAPRRRTLRTAAVSRTFPQTENQLPHRADGSDGDRETDFREAGSEHALAHDVGRPTCIAGLLTAKIGENHALPGNPVDVRSAVADQTHGIGADVALADVVAPDDEDAGLLLGRDRNHGRYGEQAGYGD